MILIRLKLLFKKTSKRFLIKIFLKVILMASSYNFKDNLTIDNNKYLKWLDVTGTSRSNVICLDNNNNVSINSNFGSISLHSNSNYTFLNSNLLLSNNIGIGFISTSDINSAVTIKKNNFISSNSNDGYLGITGDTNLSQKSRILLYGSNHDSNPSQLHLYAGNDPNGFIKMYTGSDSLKFQILQNGTSTFMPNGTTSRVIIEDQSTTITNDIVITSSTESHNASTGCLQLLGGIGIKGNLYVDGTISLNNATGNINFDSTQTSTSYTTGAIFLSGGIGISTTVNSSSASAGGALSIAGGAAIGKDTYIGGKLTVSNTEIPISSQTGSFVLHGGMGINGPIFSRSDNSPQIRLSPTTNGGETTIVFYSDNNFSNTINSSWKIGHKDGSFNIFNSNLNHVFTSTSHGNIGFFCENPTNTLQLGFGNSFCISSNLSIIGTKETSDQNDPQNTRIVLNGSTNQNSAGSIQYFSSGGDHTWYSKTNTTMSLHSTGNLDISGTCTILDETNSSNLGNGGALTVLGGASFQKDVFIGGVLNLQGGSISGGAGSSTSLSYVTITATDEAINASTGALISFGGITIQCTTEASSTTNGGSFLTLGGASIRKSLYVGGPILQIPSGDIASRPADPNYGQIRYNTETSQFEGFGPGSAWGSLGGVVDIAQTTKILASGTPSTTDGNLYFYTVESERMRINSAGNIGIATSSPNYKLHVTGDIHASIGITTGSLYVSENVIVNGPKLRIPTGNIESRPVNPQTGNIRYNTETSQFEGYGPGGAWGSLGGVVDIAQTTKILASATPSTTDGNLYFYTVGSERMRINSAGNIGIGTTSPTALVDISGDAHVNGNFIANFDTNTLGNLYTLDSKVGINTVTPNYTLDVNGSAHIAANLYIDGVITGSSQTSTSLAYITITATDAAVNFSTGSIISFGGITLQTEEDATSITNGGSFLTMGGASVGKNLFIGKNVFINSTENAVGVGTGGSFTVKGGGSFGKDLFVNGTITSSSDIRLKKDIEPFKKDTDIFLKKIEKLHTIKYNYINQDVNQNVKTKQVGFIAQEFIKDFPELLKCPENGFYSLDYQKMSVVLLECIKELKERVEYLELSLFNI
jgi:hypothetical protein